MNYLLDLRKEPFLAFFPSLYYDVSQGEIPKKMDMVYFTAVI